jgi:hypothetical protein
MSKLLPVNGAAPVGKQHAKMFLPGLLKVIGGREATKSRLARILRLAA